MENVQPNVKPLGPHEAIGTMTREQLRAELFGILEQFDIAIPQGFSAARNEHVRDVMTQISPYRLDGGPLHHHRPRMNRVLMIMLELRARELRRGA